MFCVCKKPISKKDAIRSLLAPLATLSFLTLAIGVAFGVELLIVLSLMNICGAMGDVLMVWFIAGIPKGTRFFEDINNQFVLITNEDISKRKSLGVKLVEIEDDFNKVAPKDTEKATISIGSYIIMGVACLYTVLSFWGII